MKNTPRFANLLIILDSPRKGEETTMRCRLILSLVLASAGFCAVGAPAVPMPSARLDLQAKITGTPESDKGSIYVYRKGIVGHAIALEVVLDGHVWGLLPPNSCLLMKVAPGQHTVAVLSEPHTPISVDKQSQNILAEAGESYFYKVTIHVGLSKAHARLQAMNDQKGSREVARSKRVESFADEAGRLAAQREQAAEKKQAEERAFWSSHEARMSTNNPDIGIVVPKGTPKDVTPENLSNDLLNLLLEQKVSIIEIKLFGRTISPVAAFTMTTQGLVLMERPGTMSFLVAPDCRFIDIRGTGGTFALLTKSQEESAIATAKSKGCAKPTQQLQANSTPTRQLGAPQESKMNQQISTPTPAAPHTSGSANRPHVTVLVDSTALSRLKSLPPNVLFFTSKKDPIKRLSDITDPQSQVAEWAGHAGCKEGLNFQDSMATGMLSAAIAPLTGAVLSTQSYTKGNSTATTIGLGPGAVNWICSDSFARLFQDHPHLRLYVTLQDIPGVNLIESTGGGIQVAFAESGPTQPLQANSTPTKQLVASQESKASQQVSTPAAPRETFSQFLQAGKTYEQQGDQARNEVVKASARGGSTAGSIDKEVRLYQQAIDSYTKAISIDPQSAQALILRGMVYAKRDQDEKQSDVMQSSGGMFPTVVGVIANFGPEALADLNRAVSLAPGDAQVYFVRGKIYKLEFQNKWNVYVRLSDKQRAFSDVKPDISLARSAAADFKKATAINPKMGEAYEELAGLYFMCFRFADALKNYQLAAENGIPQNSNQMNRLQNVAKDPEKAGFPKSLLNEFPLE